MICVWLVRWLYLNGDDDFKEVSFSIPQEKFVPLLSFITSPFLPQQTLPVDLSNSSVRSSGNSGASFHGSTSAFDPCCPGSTSRPPAYVSQATPGPSQPAAVDSFSSSMVAQPQPQTQPQPCRHYMHPSCEYTTFMQCKKRDLTEITFSHQTVSLNKFMIQ